MDKDPEIIRIERFINEHSKGASRVSIGGCFNRGMQYHNGDGVPQDFNKAVEFYKMAADKGHVESMYCLGMIFSDDEFEEKKDAEVAFKYFLEAAEQGHKDARDELEDFVLCYLGESKIYNVRFDEKKAITLCKKLAELGSNLAQYKLGECYENGIGVPKNRAKAFGLYEKAADNGNWFSQFILGVKYLCGDEDEENAVIDVDKAVKFLTKSSKNGNVTAHDALLLCADKYIMGNDVKQSLKKAVEVYLIASEISFNYSKSYVSPELFGGDAEIIEKLNSHEKISKYYTDEAKRISAEAQFCLGECYENGKGVVQNYNTARQWYEKAAAYGHANAKKKIKKFL